MTVFLIENGCNLNIKFDFKQTPVILAGMNKNIILIYLLYVLIYLIIILLHASFIKAF